MAHENQRFAPVKSVAVSGSESASAFWNPLAIANPDTDSEADGLRFRFIFEAVFHVLMAHTMWHENAAISQRVFNLER
jgi:hypothetical protein